MYKLLTLYANPDSDTLNPACYESE